MPVTAACAPFAAALLLPRLIATGWIRPATAILALPFAAACFFVDTAAARWLGGIAAVLIVGAAVTAAPVRRRGAAARGLIALGDASYVLYLIHPPVLMLANWACPPHWSGAAYAVVSLAGALTAAALLGPVDVALYRRLRRRIDVLTPAALKRALAAFLVVFGGCASGQHRDGAQRLGREPGPPRRRQGSWDSVAAADASIARGGLAPSPTLRAGVGGDGAHLRERVPDDGPRIRPAAAGPGMHLALFCGGRLVVLDRPRRLRRDLAGQPGYDALGTQRVGYRLRLPADVCSVENTVAVVVGPSGAMASLPVPRAALRRPDDR